MVSPAKASFQRKLAALSGTASTAPGAPAMPTSGPVASEYQLLLAALGEDLRQLSNIQALERKLTAKAAMLDRYLPWLEGALESENPAQDEIVSTMLVWSIDLADWPLALQLARHVLAHGVQLPERYKRNPATLIAEEVAEAGLAQQPTVSLETLVETASITAPFDMHDQVRAKLEKAIGLALKSR